MIYAKYTVVLKNLLDDPESKAKIDKALSTYPIYLKRSKEEWIPSFIPTREEINAKLLNHYKYREIGFETVGRFLDELEIAMCEIMPYYNQLMLSADQDFNMIYNVDYKRTIDIHRSSEDSKNATTSDTKNTSGSSSSEGSTSSEGSGTSSSNGSDSSSTNVQMSDDSKHIKSQTPQDELSITAANIDSVSYADEVDWNKNNSNSDTSTSGTSETNTNTTSSNESSSTSSNSMSEESSSNGSLNESGSSSGEESTLETTKGNYGQVSAQSLIERYRDIIVNIEQKIINDKRIKELFMQVF